MKKRLLSWLMVLTLCLTLLPTAAFAADTGAGESSGEKHEHYLCGATGESHSCSNTWDTKHEFKAWESNNSLPKSSGESYYLTTDVTLTSVERLPQDLVLCLNGHSIKMVGDRSVIPVSSGTFTLVDCKGGKTEYGQITHASGSGHGVELTGGTFNMYGGNITGNNDSGVSMTGSSTFNMYGGQITGNSTTYCGGGVYSDYQNSSKCTINMYGGEITGNTASRGGGGVFIGWGSAFTMSGGEISGNNDGGGTSSNGGGGVCVAGAMTVSGDVKITGNTKGSDSAASNVYLRGSEKFITIGGALTGGPGSIGVSKSTKNLTAGQSVKIAEGKNYALQEDDLKAFSSDAGDPYQIQKSGNELLLVNTTNVPHKHCICGKTHAAIGDHTSESETTFATKLWMDGNKLKKGGADWETTNYSTSGTYTRDYYVLDQGTYYLDEDITVDHTIYVTGSVDLCLNGHSITYGAEGGATEVIQTNDSSARLRLTDCKDAGAITHKTGTYGPGVSVRQSSTFELYNGSITGNNNYGQHGGGVSVRDGGHFNMYNGKITGNYAQGNNTGDYNGGGVYLWNYSGTSFAMYGGEISGNRANLGGGVYVDSAATATVSGAAKITGNVTGGELDADTGKYTGGTADNVYLYSGKKLTISGELTGEIGVTVRTAPTADSPVEIATGAVAGKNYSEIVKSDKGGYGIVNDNGTLKLSVVEHKHDLCGKTHTPVGDHQTAQEIDFQPWAETNKLPNTAGNWYLTGNVTLSAKWEPADGTVLDLNGYSITVNKNTEPNEAGYAGAITVNSGRTFTLADCKGEQGKYGKITHGTNTETNSKYPGSGVCVLGTFLMYGGNITDNEVKQNYRSGGGVCVYASAAIFTMYGGSITDNKSNNTNGSNVSGAGGGVYTIGTFTMYGGNITGNEAYRDGGGVLMAGDFTMYDGTISGNTAKGQHYVNDYIGGGGVFVVKGKTFTMKGGTISDNTAYGAGGGVYMQDYQGSFVMENGTISGNRAVVENSKSYYAGKGGGVYVGSTSDCIFTMKNGSITGNSAAKDGGGVYVTGRFTMSGGTIGGTAESDANTASGDGGGVYVYSSSSSYVHACVMSGNATVTGNKKGDGTANNVWLPSNGRYIIISGELTGTHPIGVTMSNYPKNGWTIPITYTNTNYNYTVTEADKDKFTSDMDGYEIKFRQSDNRLVLAENTAPTQIEVPTAKTDLTYNGAEQTGVASGEGYTLTGNTATSAGSYTATATLEDGYTWSDGGTDAKTISWNIAKKTPELSDFVMSKPTDLVYDGAEKSATVALKSGLTGCDFTVNYYMDGVLQADGELPKNVGHYTFGVTVSESSTNFTASKSEILDTTWGFDIVKADLTGITATGYTGEYDGQAHGITVTGAPEGTTIRYNSVDTPAIGYDNDRWGSSSLNYTDAGTYTVYYRVYGANYNTFGDSAVVTISKTDPEEPADLVGRLGQALSTVELPEGWTWVDPTIVMDTLGAQRFYANYAGSKNFNAKQDVEVIVTVTDKTEAGVSISAPTAKTYGDAEFTVTAAAAHTGDAALWSWRSSNASVLKISDLHGEDATIEVVGAGTATLTAIYNSATTIGQASVDITVNKATVTVTAKNQSIYVGGTAPDLSSPVKDTHYTVSGLVGDDALTGMLTMQYQKNGEAITPHTTKAGTYDIVISGVMEPAGGNYNAIVLNNGTLTIENRSSGSGGSYTPTYPVSAPSKTENGSVSSNVKNAAKGSTVTITVKPEAGFKLAALTVTDKDGNVLTLTDKGDGTYTFTMPAGEVEVNAVFAEEVETSPFTDVSTKAYYYEAVKWAQEKGITGGIGNNLFGSNQPCTRAQIVTFLWRAAGSPEPKGSAAGMTDVAAGSYYEKAVAWAIENGITNGTTATTFSPNDTCTRAQAVTFLARALNAKADSKAEFSDVPTNSYFADAVAWAAANGVTTGIGGGLFGPDDDCTRGQIVTFLYRAYMGK